MENLIEFINSPDQYKITNENLFLERSHCQGMSGYIYSNYSKYLSTFLNKELKKEWKVQFIRNTLYRHYLNKIIKICNQRDMPITALKGMTLIGTIYTDIGSRSISDIDLLLDKNDIKKVERILIDDFGFKVLDCNRWSENDYKVNLVKFEDNVEIVFELHSKLFKKDNKIWKVSNNELIIEDNFVHLVGHLTYQHTFLKLHWLLDIYKYWQIHGRDLNIDRIGLLVKDLNLNNSFYACIIALKNNFDLKHETKLIELEKIIKPKYSLLFQYILTPNFLCFPQNHKVRYYILKHLLKESFLNALKYDFNWMRSKGWK